MSDAPTTPTGAELRAQARTQTAAQPTATLVTVLRMLANPTTVEETMARAWVIEALEDRYPAASAAVEAAFDAWDTACVTDPAGNHPDVDYVAVLLANIPGVTA